MVGVGRTPGGVGTNGNGDGSMVGMSTPGSIMSTGGVCLCVCVCVCVRVCIVHVSYICITYICMYVNVYLYVSYIYTMYSICIHICYYVHIYTGLSERE
jgi:hypothetical protein